MNEVTGLLTPMQFMHNLHLIYEDEKEMNKYGTTENFWNKNFVEKITYCMQAISLTGLEDLIEGFRGI